jgi:hypothetical protein
MSQPSVETARDWPAKAVVGHEGDPLGRIAYIYLDRVTGQPTWALVVTGRLRRKPTFVPLTQAVAEDDRVRVPVAGATVRKSPRLTRRRELSERHEARLLEHYGELAGLASSHSGARRAPTGTESGPRLRRRPRQQLERATAVATGTGTSRALRRLLLAGLGLAGSLATSRLLTTRRPAPKGMLGVSKAATAWRRQRPAGRRRPVVVVVNARPARRRVPPPPRPSRPQRRSPLPGDLKLTVGLAVGYVLGARAGRERYERIAEQARRFWQGPQVENVVATGSQSTSADVTPAAGRVGGPSPTAKPDDAAGR